MSNIVKSFFGSRPTFKTVTINGFDFDIVSLSTEAQEDIGACESYAEMLNFAADNGLAFNRERIVDDEDKALDIPLFWAQGELESDDEPTIKEQVGQAVCEISNLAEVIGKQALAEKPDDDAETIDEDEIAEQLNRHPSSIA